MSRVLRCEKTFIQFCSFCHDCGHVLRYLLCENITRNKEEIAIFLATSGCNIGAVNQNGRTTVHIAAYENMPRALKLFLDNGCDPNKKVIIYTCNSVDARTGFHITPYVLL